MHLELSWLLWFPSSWSSWAFCVRGISHFFLLLVFVGVARRSKYERYLCDVRITLFNGSENCENWHAF